VQQAIERIVKAYKALRRITKRDMPTELLKIVLREVKHIAIHELAHAALHTVCPELRRLEEKEPTLGTCIDEVAARAFRGIRA